MHLSWSMIINFGILSRTVQMSLMNGTKWLNVYLTQFLLKNHCSINIKYDLILYNIPTKKKKLMKHVETRYLIKCFSYYASWSQSWLNYCKFLCHPYLQQASFELIEITSNSVFYIDIASFEYLNFQNGNKTCCIWVKLLNYANC